MRRALLSVALLPALALTPACNAGEEEPLDGFREGEMQLNTNIRLMKTEEGGGDDGTVIWEILEAGVYAGEASDGNLLMTIEGTDIYNAEGVLTCSVSASYLSGIAVTSSATQEVLYTVLENHVYMGKIDIGGTSTDEQRHQDELVLTFVQNQVFYGNLDLLVYEADKNLEASGDGQKLLIATILGGDCL